MRLRPGVAPVTLAAPRRARREHLPALERVPGRPSGRLGGACGSGPGGWGPRGARSGRELDAVAVGDRGSVRVSARRQDGDVGGSRRACPWWRDEGLCGDSGAD